ncbi:MAG: hypothetical protein Q9166_001756 [cf. Caloplaca sp. 2 TL-2023]
MPFPYQTSATPVRTRKPLRDREKDREREKERDKDGRSTTSGSGKKHREASRSSNRSPLPSSSRPASLYAQTNVTLEQLPPLPRSETASPSSIRSPTFRANTGSSTSSHSLSSSTHFTTPAALQPYLETDDDEDFDDAQTPQASSSAQVKPYFDADLVKVQSTPESIQKPSAPSPTASTAPTAKTHSPQNPPTSPIALSRVSTRSSDPNSNLHHPRPYHIPISSPTFPSAQPFFGAAPSEQHFPHPPSASQYYSMAQAPGHPMEMQAAPPQNYYQSYGPPQQVQPPHFSPIRNQPAREHSSANSRMSFSGDPFNTMGQMPMIPTESALPPEYFPASAIEGEDDAVLKRIQNAIPDLNLLLTRYRQTSGQLGEREVTLRQTEAEKAQVLEQKDTYIQRLAQEVQEASKRNTDENKRHGEEKDKLRLEIGNMTEKHNELQESLQAEKKRREDTEKALQALGAEHRLLQLRLQEEKAAMARDHEDWRAKALQESAAMNRDFQLKEKGYVDQQQRQAQEFDDRLKALSTELTHKHAKEKEKLETAASLRNRELEDIHTRLQRDLDDARNAHKKILDDHVRKHGQEKEAWHRDRESLMKDWENERANMGQGSEELVTQHRAETSALQQEMSLTEARLKKEHADAIDKMQMELDRLFTDKTRFSKLTTELRDSTSKLIAENNKLHRLADAFEQVTDLRGRGDAF